MVAGLVNPADGVGVGAGRVGACGNGYAPVPEVADGVQPGAAFTEDFFKIFVRFLRPVYKRRLHRQQNMILFAYIKPLFRGQTGVNYGVTVIFPGEIVQGGLERRRRLTECVVAYGVHFDLQSGAVGALAELRHLLVRVVENAPVIALILVRLEQSRVHGAEAAVQCGGKAAPYAGQVALLYP